MTFDVICAHCGKQMHIGGLIMHYQYKHNWKTLSNGRVDWRSNPMWKQKTPGDQP